MLHVSAIIVQNHVTLYAEYGENCSLAVVTDEKTICVESRAF